MRNWKILDAEKEATVWDFIYGELKFEPTSGSSNVIAPAIPNEHFDISNFYNESFNENHYSNFLKDCKIVFSIISGSKEMFAMCWQHDCYSFKPELPFEEDEFGDWLVSAFPNGDYIFFLTHDLKQCLFGDGIRLNITLCGPEILEAFKARKTHIFGFSD